MIDLDLEFCLSLPWNGEVFKAHNVGPINFLVGPNGSGKSQFARQLLGLLNNPRLLGTDRLSGMEQVRPFNRFTGDYFANGLDKNRFGELKQAGTEGAGIDALVILEERMDLRIQIEATLSHLFDREIILEWDSGRLLPKVRRLNSSASYRLDREECHGIKELLVLLTHLYDHRHHYLIIDEPELNLHPQYQAFFMQEVRKVAGNPSTGDNKKIVFLITHSSFILDFQSLDDLNSVISFSLDYSAPKQVQGLRSKIQPSLPFIKKLNAHHKQLFFSDNPIFVEGIQDAWLVEAMMNARGVSVAAAGSCIIDSGGAEEVNQYLKLCRGLGKNAYFLYDLDSLFDGNLRSCINDDESVQSFLASAGLGNDFGKYCGQLEKKLSDLINEVLNTNLSDLPRNLHTLSRFLISLDLRNQAKSKQWKKARTAVMTALSRYRADMVSVISQSIIEDVEGRRAKILTALNNKNVHVLSGGTLERYLPHYSGDEYELSSDAKRLAVYKEIAEMTNLTIQELAQRYGELFSAVCNLPSKAEVDLDAALTNHLSKYIHELQRTVVNNPHWEIHQIVNRLRSLQLSWDSVFSIQEFKKTSQDGFEAKIRVIAMLGQRERVIHVNDRTNAGMGYFRIQVASSEGIPGGQPTV